MPNVVLRSAMAMLLTSAVVVGAGYQLGTSASAADKDGRGGQRERKKEKDKDDAIEEMMERVHEGRKSPLGRTKTALAADAVAWDTLDKQLAAFEKMSKALDEAKDQEVQQSSGGYVDAVKELAAATKQRDSKGARAALKSLLASCADCHYKGGPGGRLDDD